MPTVNEDHEIWNLKCNRRIGILLSADCINQNKDLLKKVESIEAAFKGMINLQSEVSDGSSKSSSMTSAGKAM